MGQHLLTIEDLSKEEIEKIIYRASYFEQYHPFIRQQFQNRFVANFFLEASTRTRFSFEVAEKRLGAEVLQFQPNISSITKGESLLDTLKTLESIGVETAIIRIREEGLLQELSKQVSLRIVNAGEGRTSHPTQALLDLFTIKKYFQDVKGLNIAIIGDVTHSRVARSDAALLKKMGANILFSGPDSLMDKSLGQIVPIDNAIQLADVVIMLRIQFERQESEFFNAKEIYRQQFGFTEDRLKHLQSHAIILHPAPVNRGLEMDDAVVDHPQSKIFEQIKNGVWVRMAVIERALGGNEAWNTLSNKDESGIRMNGLKVIS